MNRKLVKGMVLVCAALAFAGCSKKQSNVAIGSTKYYYEQLNEDEKKFYKQLISASEAVLNGTEKINKIDNGNGQVTYYYGSFTPKNISQSRATEVAYIFYSSCPGYFFASGNLKWDGDKCSMMIWEDYGSADQIKDYKAKIDATAKEWLSQLDGCKDDLEKEKKICQLICKNTELGFTARKDASGKALTDANGNEVMNWNNQFIVGPLVDGKAYGNGYAKTLQYLCNQAGVDCIYVQATEAGSNCWNMVKLGDDWYCVDTGMLDSDGTKPNSLHWNKSYDTFANAMDGEAHSINAKYSDYGLKLPSCTKDTAPGETEFFTGESGDFSIVYGELKEYTGSDANVIIPETVCSVDAVVFNVDHDIESFEVDEKNPWLCAVDGVLFTKDKETLVCYPKVKEGAYTVPAGTKKIADRAFLYNQGVSSLSLPDGLEEIGAGAILFTANITEMNLPDSIQNIGFQSMGGAKFLDGKIELPKNLKEVYGYAFMNSGMTECVISEGVTRLLDGTFTGCGSLQVVHLPASLTTMGPAVFENCPLTDIYFAGSKEQWEAMDVSKAMIADSCEIHFDTP